nr:MAG TPA: hypothetical protein [Caudoviricetes sp.]
MRPPCAWCCRDRRSGRTASCGSCPWIRSPGRWRSRNG